jgi:peptidoglycan/LPS O-acetylase OafA/YrhL
MSDRKTQIPALTGLRGIAAWMVVCFHFREGLYPYVPLPVFHVAEAGNMAVDLFFVLSGFIMSLNYRADFIANGMRHFPRFMLLRFARIYPLHAFMLVMFALYALAASIAHHRSEFHDLGYLVRSILLVQNWIPGSPLEWNVPAWSISTELFAYLLFPLLIWWGSRVGSIWVMGAFLVADLWLLAFLAPIMGGLGSAEKFGLVRCVCEFWAGLMVYQIWEASGRGRAVGYGCLGAAAALVVGYAAGFPDAATIPAAFCFLVYALAGSNTILSVALSNRVVVFLGDISYATYLFHFLGKIVTKLLLERPGIPEFVVFPAYVVMVLAVSYPLYRFVELPGQRFIRRLGKRAARPSVSKTMCVELPIT